VVGLLDHQGALEPGGLRQLEAHNLQQTLHERLAHVLDIPSEVLAAHQLAGIFARHVFVDEIGKDPMVFPMITVSYSKKAILGT